MLYFLILGFVHNIERACCSVSRSILTVCSMRVIKYDINITNDNIKTKNVSADVIKIPSVD